MSDEQSDKIDRVAKAIFEDMQGWLSDKWGAWHPDEFRDTAKRVIAAMEDEK